MDPGTGWNQPSGRSRNRNTGGNPKRAARCARVGRPGTAPSRGLARIRGDCHWRGGRGCLPDRDAATGSGDREQPRFGGFSSFPRRIAFAAFYTAAVASASMVGFSLLQAAAIPNRRLPAFESDISSGTETVAVPGATADRAEADANGIWRTQIVGADAAPAPEPSQSGEPDLATPRPLEPIPVGVQETVSAPRREAETAPQPNAGQPEAIGN